MCDPGIDQYTSRDGESLVDCSLYFATEQGGRQLSSRQRRPEAVNEHEADLKVELHDQGSIHDGRTKVINPSEPSSLAWKPCRRPGQNDRAENGTPSCRDEAPYCASCSEGRGEPDDDPQTQQTADYEPNIDWQDTPIREQASVADSLRPEGGNGQRADSSESHGLGKPRIRQPRRVQPYKDAASSDQHQCYNDPESKHGYEHSRVQ